MIEIISKDVGEVIEKRGGEYRETFEDLNENYIKKELGIENECY